MPRSTATHVDQHVYRRIDITTSEVWSSRFNFHSSLPHRSTALTQQRTHKMGGSVAGASDIKVKLEPTEIPSDRASSGSRKVSERYRDSSADVELVSSDGTSFLVHSYHLRSARYVLFPTLYRACMYEADRYG